MSQNKTDSRPSELSESRDEQLFTRKNFERELKNLAKKAQEETLLKWIVSQSLILLRVGAIYSLAATFSNVSILNLSPVYGAIPSKRLHSQGVWVSCFLGWSLNIFLRNWLFIKPQQILPLIAAYIPFVHFYLFRFSDILGASYGPLLTESLTFFPLLTISTAVAANYLDELEMKWGWVPNWISDSLPGILSFSFFKTVELLTERGIQKSIGNSVLQTRLGLQVVLIGVYSAIAPSKILLFIIPAVLHLALFNTHIPSPYAQSLLESSLEKKGWSLLERQESLTGYISVLENHEKKFRVIRCDHSILGGEWLSHVNTRGIAEPIYGVFVMLEAVRLVELKNPILDSEANAYVIGLGVGTTPTALMKHGIETTIVEIDPVVHEFSSKYFHLPRNHKIVIDDAISYTAKTARSNQKFDYIIHDVFTGGAVPLELFTIQFIQDLSSILKPRGVIAINYAGDISLPAAHIIIQTIRSVFLSCRIFRETETPSKSKFSADSGRDFANMVIFCTNAVGDIKFRQPNLSDLLDSGARQQFLLPKHEIDFPSTTGQKGVDDLLHANNTEKFQIWQEKSSLGHWSLMRTVFPAFVWEMW